MIIAQKIREVVRQSTGVWNVLPRRYVSQSDFFPGCGYDADLCVDGDQEDSCKSAIQEVAHTTEREDVMTPQSTLQFVSIFENDNKENMEIDACPPIGVCQYLINEISSYNKPVSSNGRKEYVEIRQICPEGRNRDGKFPGLKLIHIDTVGVNIHMIATLTGKTTPINGYFVIQINTEIRSYIQKALEGSEAQLLNSGADSPQMLALISCKLMTKEKWKSFNLNSNTRGKVKVTFKRKITDEMQSVIQTAMIDAQFYGKARNDEIKIDKLMKRIEGCNFVLSDVTNDDMTDQKSLNLCATQENLGPFKYDNFKRGNPTPGGPNHCPTESDYIVNEIENILPSPLSSENFLKVGVTKNPKFELECLKLDHKFSSLLVDINSELVRIQNLGYRDYKLADALYTVNREEWLSKLEAIAVGDRDFTSLNNNELKTTFNFYEDNSDPMIIGHRMECSLCIKEVKFCPYAYRAKDLDRFSKTPGYLVTDNRKTIIDMLQHKRKNTHLYSILRVTRRDRQHLTVQKSLTTSVSSNTKISASDMFGAENVFSLEVTFRAVYAEIVMNIAPTQHVHVMQLLESVGVSVGRYLVHRNTVFSMNNIIASDMRSTLFSYWLKQRPLLTIILDGSTSKKHHHYLMVYFQSMEGSRSVVYFYSIINTGKSSTAETMFQKLEERMKADGIYELVLEKLVAFVSDSATVNFKLKQIFNEKTGREIFPLFCLAHKLQLVSRHTITDEMVSSEGTKLNYIKDVELKLNTHYNFIKPQRNIGEFRETILELGESNTQLTYFFQTRWIASEFNVLKRFILGYRTLIKTYEKIEVDKKYHSKANREKAAALKREALDKNFLVTIMFLYDYSCIFKKWSVKLQYKSALLIEQYKNYNDMITNIEHLKNLNTPRITSYLANVQCKNVAEGPNYDEDNIGCTINEYEEANKVKYKDMILNDVDPNAVKLTVLVPYFIEKLLSELNKYIPLEVVKSFHVFNHKNFPSSILALEKQYKKTPEGYYDYGHSELKHLCSIFHWNPTVITDWAKLIPAILESKYWGLYREATQSGIFWSSVLQDNSLPWTTGLKHIIKTAMILPGGSIEPEVGFSIYNIIMTDKRAVMTDKHLDDIMFIKINSEGDIEAFDAGWYARVWLLKGHYTPNKSPPMQGKKRKLNECPIKTNTNTEETLDSTERREDDESNVQESTNHDNMQFDDSLLIDEVSFDDTDDPDLMSMKEFEDDIKIWLEKTDKPKTVKSLLFR